MKVLEQLHLCSILECGCTAATYLLVDPRSTLFDQSSWEDIQLDEFAEYYFPCLLRVNCTVAISYYLLSMMEVLFYTFDANLVLLMHLVCDVAWLLKFAIMRRDNATARMAA